MEFNEFSPLRLNYYARLLDGTPYGLILNGDRELVGTFVVLYGLEAFRRHCTGWLTLCQIEAKRQDITGESGGWINVIPTFSRCNPWKLMCLSLPNEHLEAMREEIANSGKFKFDVDE